MKSKPSSTDTNVLLEFMFRLAQAYLASGEQTAQVELQLRRIASAYGMRRSRVVVFPTAIFISLHDSSGERITLAEGPTQTLSLDQIADIYTLGDATQRGELAPSEGLERLSAILRAAPRFGVAGDVGGHTILAIGLAMVLMPVLSNLVAAAALGALVGALKAFNRDRPVLAAPLSVVAAMLVSVLTFLAVKLGLPVEPRYALVPPLVAFLPGAMLTLGMVELAYGDMVSGSSRLLTGFVQLVLLAFGLAVGAALVGYSHDTLLDSTHGLLTAPGPAWAPWAGAVVFGLGAYLHFSAPRKSLGWMLLVLLLTLAAQRFTTGLIGKEISGFFGTLVATPLGYLVQTRFKGPPAMVTFLPSFWLLVPGSLGLMSVTHMLSDRTAGLAGLSTVVFALASIALGTLVGASLYRWLSERFGSWETQIGRAVSLRRRNK